MTLQSEVRESGPLRTIILSTGALMLVIAVVASPKEAFDASIQGLDIWWKIIFPDAPVPHVIPNAHCVWLHPRHRRLAWTVNATLVQTPRQRRSGDCRWHVRRIPPQEQMRIPFISG